MPVYVILKTNSIIIKFMSCFFSALDFTGLIEKSYSKYNNM